jgi:hypothetical protein
LFALGCIVRDFGVGGCDAADDDDDENNDDVDKDDNGDDVPGCQYNTA